MAGDVSELATLQAEAQAYQEDFVSLKHARRDLDNRAAHNRQRGLALIQSMRAVGVATLQVGRTILRPHHDNRGFERIELDAPTEGGHPHADR